MKMKTQQEQTHIKSQLKKMNDIFDAYYDMKLKSAATRVSQAAKKANRSPGKSLKKESVIDKRDDSYSMSPENRNKTRASKSPSKTRSSSMKRVKPALKRAQSAKPSGPKKIVRL